MRSFLRTLLVAAACLVAALSALADEFPSRPVKIIVPYPAGGIADFVSRNLAERLSKTWNVAVIVDNRPGASGNIGTAAIARADADGYTLGYVATQHVTAPALFAQLPFALSDFRALTIPVQFRLGLLATPGLKANSVPELIAMLKESPGKYTVAHAGPTTNNYLWLKTFEQVTGTRLLAVPYKGSSAAYPDLIAGNVDLMFDAPSMVMPLVKSGKMKVLAVGGSGRSPLAPETPTLEESGFAVGRFMTGWNAVLVPAKTPPTIADKIERDIVAALKDPALRAKLQGAGLEVVASSSAQANALIDSEAKRLAEVIRSNGVKAD
ncbi:MAG TPA: tripartite tricarboxylate transporter substrate-binding protein [Ramlibacter sp.]|nr:tripartite tricarboxylate transporter substrate-binding protein [Ramlibacter sp.]